MRFTNGRRGISPSAGFVGGDPIKHTRPNAVVVGQALPVGVYPSSSVQMAAAVGFGRWDYGWLMDETTGSLTASFTPSAPLALQFDTAGGRGGNAVYGNFGWLSGSDLYVGFTGSSRVTRFDGGANFNIPAGADLLFGFVGRWTSITSSFGTVFGRTDPAFVRGWALNGAAGTAYNIELTDGVNFFSTSIPGGVAGYRIGEWHVAIGGLDRSNGAIGFGIRSLDTGATLIAPAAAAFPSTAVTASSNFFFGASDWVSANETFQMAALYLSTGSQVATGVLGNITLALENFARQLGGVITGTVTNSNLPSHDDSNELTVVMTGSVMRSVTGLNAFYEPFSSAVASSSVVIEGSISKGRGYERKKLNAILLGQTATAIGRTPFPSPNVMDVGPTGTFVSPSWTHASVGFNQAFVGTALSSSNYENLIFNTFTSGTEPLETTAVPASATLFYSKETRFQTVMVKKTASVLDTVIRSGSWVPKSFAVSSGVLFSEVTGVAEDALVPGELTSKVSSVWAPASILIPVTGSGRIVDIKVWVELIQGSSSADPFPLGNLAIALRSPNLTWGNAHPIRNDPKLVRVYTSPGDTFSYMAGVNEGFRRMYAGTGSNVNRFYRDTFLLWEGPAVFDNTDFNDPGFGLDGGQSVRRYPVWQRDRGMRTVFSDGAPVLNPRHLLEGVYPSASNFNGAPNAAVGIARNAPFGSDVPWTSEANIRGSQTFAAAGSPPAGWLTGPGAAADVNEWPTTGVNYGTNTIRPLYPLLDPLLCKKRVTGDAQPTSGTNNQTLPESYRPDIWAGARPGLRGTEISGTWELLLVAGGSLVSNPVPNWYFRQVRLEFTVETPSYTRAARFPRRRGPVQSTDARQRLVALISGSDAALYPPFVASPLAGWDYWVTEVYVPVDHGGEIGRSFGLAGNSGSFPSDRALVYRLTGSLASISGSIPGWLFTGQGGMPIIPESSATLVPRTPQPIVTIPFSNFIQPRRDLDIPQRLGDIASDANPQMRLRDLAAVFVSSSAT
jgi:hypothetical protein